MEFWQKRPDVLKQTDSKRLFQNKRLYFDDNDEYGGHPNTIPPNYVVYKDLMVFKKVFQGDYFGGRTLIAERDMRNVKRQILRQGGYFSHQTEANQFIRESLKNHNHLKN